MADTALLKEPGLTLKQRKFLKIYLETGNGSEAAMQVYHCKSRAVAGAISSENLQKLKEPIRMLMESRGLSLGRLLEVLNEGLGATKPTNAAILVQKDGKVVKAEEQGLIETVDYGTRHKYMESMAKWLEVEKLVVNVHQKSQQWNYFSVSEKDKNDFNEKFTRFLKDFYSKESPEESPSY